MMASVSPWHSPVILRAVPSFLAISDILILLLAPALGLEVFAPLKGNGFRRQDLHLRKSVVALMSLCSCPLDRHTCIHKTYTHLCAHQYLSIYHLFIALSVQPHLYPFIYLSLNLFIIHSSFHPLIYSHIYSFSSIYHPRIHLSICVSSFSSIHLHIHPCIIYPSSVYLWTHPSFSQPVINPSMCVPIHPFVRLSIIYQSTYLYVHPPT